jgi:hypothetical protein
VNLFKKSPQQAEEPMGPVLVAVFSGRGSPEMCQQTFGWLMQKLKLWGTLKTPEDVALHNAALEIFAEMRALPAVNLKQLEKLTLVIEMARPEDGV